MKVVIKNHYTHLKKGPRFEKLLKSWGFKADNTSPAYCHVGDGRFDTEFFNFKTDTVCTIDYAVVDLNTLKFKPHNPSWGDIEQISKRRLHIWVKTHQHRFKHEKFGI